MRVKWKGVLGVGGIALVSGGCWLAAQIYSLNEMLRQAMPIDVMTGADKYPVYIYLSDDTMSNDDSWGGRRVRSFPVADGFIWRSIQPRTLWELVYLATAKEKHHRLIGLRLLSSLNNLNDSICREIAQASDFQMAIGLARSKTADLRLLLPPPPLPPLLKTSEIQDDLCDVLKALPILDSNKCVEYLTLLALEQIQSSQQIEGHEWWYGGGVEESPKKLRKPSKENLALLFLHSMLVHSIIEEHRDQLIHLRILPILMKLYTDRTWTKTSKTCSLIAQVLGNLALDERFHYAFFQSGWISVLAEWSRNADVELALNSERVLANLDRLSGTNKFEDGIYVAHPCHFDGDSKAVLDVVFIHGLLGGAFKTWRQNDILKKLESSSATSAGEGTGYTYCWPKDWLAKDLPHIRIILIDYETHLTEWGSRCPYDKERTLEARSKRLLEKLEAAGVGRRPIVWVSHSMGGLLMKQILILSQASSSPRVQQLYKQTRGSVFFSVPHRGTKIAMPHFGSQYITFPSPEVKQLHYESKYLIDLHQKYLNLFPNVQPPCLSFCETKDTKLGHLNLSAKFVSRESSNISQGEFHCMDTDHLYICKPSNKDSFIYRRVVEFIGEQVRGVEIEKQNHSENLQTMGVT